MSAYWRCNGCGKSWVGLYFSHNPSSFDSSARAYLNNQTTKQENDEGNVKADIRVVKVVVLDDLSSSLHQMEDLCEDCRMELKKFLQKLPAISSGGM